jgi:hypothetical protein
MRFYKGTATDTLGAKHNVDVSQARTLVKFDDGRFAVRAGYYRRAVCPYLEAGHSMRLTVSVNGHSFGKYDDTITGDFDIFRKAALMLPNTCIESAEHVLKCTRSNAHVMNPIANGVGARVKMSIPGCSYDIDEFEMDEKAFEAFPQGPDLGVDATLGGFEPGEGMALVYSRDPELREEGKWKVHAVAVLLKSSYQFDPFVVVSEVFAPDDGRELQMTLGWKLAFYQGAQDFRDHYQCGMSPTEYSLWKLSSEQR